MKREFCLKIYSILLDIFLSLGLATINMQATSASSRHNLAPPSTPAPSDNLTSQPNPDRLAIPVLAENPTQVELGSNVYYYNCMPCHGDQGQGLTEEFRQLWDEDHQNCWGRGCHGGRRDDQGFPLPRQIPAVNHLSGALMQFPTAEDLYNFLHTSHPPQRPGALEENEYWEVTAFLLEENGRLAPDGQIGPASHQNLFDEILAICGVFAVILLLAGSLIWQTRSTRTRNSP
jgi:hypothetical protein